MNGKSMNTRQRKFRVSLFVLLAGILSLATTANQSQQAPTLRIVSEDGNRVTPIHYVLITPEGIAALPAGENRILQNNGGSGGGLTKVGPGTLVLSSGNSGVNLVKTGSGILKLPNASDNGPALVKKQNAERAGGTLTLTNSTLSGNSGYVVYEFLGLGPNDFGGIMVPTAARPQESMSLNFEKIKISLQHQRPLSAMNGWPFKRLLIGSPAAIAQVEGWKRGTITSNPGAGSKFVCTEGFCACSGSADCMNLVSSGSCSVNMNCDGTSDGIKCYCSTR